MLDIRSKAFIIITKVLIVHHSYYHGYRKKEQPNSSVPKDSRLSRLCRGAQLYPHGETGLTSISRAPKIRFPHVSNLSLIQPECQTKGSTGFPVNVLDIPDRGHPLASFTNTQVATSYLACRPHLRHVVCTGGYSNLRIPIHGPYCSTSYVI